MKKGTESIWEVIIQEVIVYPLIIFGLLYLRFDNNYNDAFTCTILGVGEIWIFKSTLYLYYDFKDKVATKKQIYFTAILCIVVVLLFYLFLSKKYFVIGLLLPLAILPVILVDTIKRLFK